MHLFKKGGLTMREVLNDDKSDTNDDFYFQESSIEKEQAPQHQKLAFVAGRATSWDLEGQDDEIENCAIDYSISNVGNRNRANSGGLLGLAGLDEESAAEEAEKYDSSGMPRQESEQNVAGRRSRPPPLKAYSAPFQSYFTQLLQEDGKSVDDSLVYSPNTYAVSVWKGDVDDISTIGSLTNCKSADRENGYPTPIIKKTVSGDSLPRTDTDDSLDDDPHRKKKVSRKKGRVSTEDNETNNRLLFAVLGLMFFILTVTCVALILSLIRVRQRNQVPISNLPVDSPSPLPDSPPPPIATNTPPIFSTELDLLEMIGKASPKSLPSLDDPASPQYRAFKWLAVDPRYHDYPLQRIIQRWVLVTLFLSTSGRSFGGRRALSSRWNITDGWMTYTNECRWYTTHTDSMCDDNGVVVAIRLENNGLRGTLPLEIGQLTMLDRFVVRKNRISGTLPPELGNLSTLELAENEFFGTIPSEVSQMTSLEFLALETNHLTGTVPTELGMLSSLTSISLYKNDLSGVFPAQMCQLDGLTTLQADCDEIVCECCTECCSGCQHQGSGVLVPGAQLGSSVPSDQPSLFPSRAPSDLPTVPPSRIPTDLPTRAVSDTPSAFPTAIASHSPSNAPTVVPTKPPTSVPTSSPSETPTSNPTQCQVAITNDKSCYDPRSDKIKIVFENCYPQRTDWIGIFDTRENPDNLFEGQAEAWVRLCGDQNCRKQVKRGSVIFGPLEGDSKKGSYLIHMIRGHSAYATTENIVIDRNCA